MKKVYTHTALVWDGEQCVVDHERSAWYWYDGPIELVCGASSAETQLGQQQTSAYTQMTQQASQVFGNSSAVFGDLMKTFAPTVAAGPNQQGFSPAELSALNSSAITDTGQAYRNAKSAVGEAESAQGGGNTANVTGGAKTGTDLGIATSAAAQTSGELNQINQANYQTGRQNYDTAAAGLAGAPNVFGAADSANSAATNAGNAAVTTQNDISTQNDAWIQGVTGALGSVAGAATGSEIQKHG